MGDILVHEKGGPPLLAWDHEALTKGPIAELPRELRVKKPEAGGGRRGAP